MHIISLGSFKWWCRCCPVGHFLRELLTPRPDTLILPNLQAMVPTNPSAVKPWSSHAIMQSLDWTWESAEPFYSAGALSEGSRGHPQLCAWSLLRCFREAEGLPTPENSSHSTSLRWSRINGPRKSRGWWMQSSPMHCAHMRGRQNDQALSWASSMRCPVTLPSYEATHGSGPTVVKQSGLVRICARNLSTHGVPRSRTSVMTGSKHVWILPFSLASPGTMINTQVCQVQSWAIAGVLSFCQMKAGLPCHIQPLHKYSAALSRLTKTSATRKLKRGSGRTWKWSHKGSVLIRVVGRVSLSLLRVAAKELKWSYHNPETTFFIMYPNMIIWN